MPLYLSLPSFLARSHKKEKGNHNEQLPLCLKPSHVFYIVVENGKGEGLFFRSVWRESWPVASSEEIGARLVFGRGKEGKGREGKDVE